MREQGTVGRAFCVIFRFVVGDIVHPSVSSKTIILLKY